MESAKECVTTHLPKQLALKMDDAVAWSRYSTVVRIPAGKCDLTTSKRAVAVALKVSDVSPPGAAANADLGGSSKYSSENLED